MIILQVFAGVWWIGSFISLGIAIAEEDVSKEPLDFWGHVLSFSSSWVGIGYAMGVYFAQAQQTKVKDDDTEDVKDA